MIWAASTITFFVPRISPKNPIRERFAELARTGGFSPADLEKIIDATPSSSAWISRCSSSTGTTWASILRFDLGYSLNKYPETVIELIMEALPWTIGAAAHHHDLSFVIGNLLGALAAWPRAPGWVRAIATPFVLLHGRAARDHGRPSLFFVGFRLKLLPLGGAYSTGMVPNWSDWGFWLDVLRHQILPALALIAWLGGRLGAVDARHGHHHPG